MTFPSRSFGRDCPAVAPLFPIRRLTIRHLSVGASAAWSLYPLCLAALLALREPEVLEPTSLQRRVGRTPKIGETRDGVPWPARLCAQPSRATVAYAAAVPAGGSNGPLPQSRPRGRNRAKSRDRRSRRSDRRSGPPRYSLSGLRKTAHRAASAP